MNSLHWSPSGMAMSIVVTETLGQREKDRRGWTHENLERRNEVEGRCR